MSLVIHVSVILSPSLYPSGFGSIIPSLLCHYVFLQAPGCLPLTSHITAMLRGCLRADRCCIHPPLSPPTQKKPSSFSLSCMALPLVCARHSCQQRMDHFQILVCHMVCPKTKKKGVVWLWPILLDESDTFTRLPGWYSNSQPWGVFGGSILGWIK